MKTEAAIHRMASALLKDSGIGTPPVDVEVVAASLGAKIRKETADADISGALYRLETGPVIGVNASHPPLRQRFTIAHELGHLVLHEEPVFVDRVYLAPPVRNRPVYLRDARSSQATDPLEVEANKFAAALLMPSPFIRQALSDKVVPVGTEGLRTLADEFQVSEQAMGFRLINLGVPVEQT